MPRSMIKKTTSFYKDSATVSNIFGNFEMFICIEWNLIKIPNTINHVDAIDGNVNDVFLNHYRFQVWIDNLAYLVKTIQTKFSSVSV